MQQKNVSEENLQNTRDHRGFAGLSRGSKTTVNSGMMHCADLFAYIGSYSGAWADVEEFKKILNQENIKNMTLNIGTMEMERTIFRWKIMRSFWMKYWKRCQSDFHWIKM